MTVAHDASTETTAWTTTPDPFTFDHTPVGTPAGALVWVITGGSAADVITSVSYGGTAMTRVLQVLRDGTEDGSATAYFLGSSIPTGLQTVSIDHTAGATSKYAVAVTVTAASDTAIVVTGSVNAATADPQVALDTGADSSLRYVGMFSGLNAPSSATLLASMSAVQDIDFGTFSGIVGRQTTASTGSFTVGWTAVSSDAALVAVAIQETAAVVAAPYPYVGGGYYPTEG